MFNARVIGPGKVQIEEVAHSSTTINLKSLSKGFAIFTILISSDSYCVEFPLGSSTG